MGIDLPNSSGWSTAGDFSINGQHCSSDSAGKFILSRRHSLQGFCRGFLINLRALPAEIQLAKAQEIEGTPG